MKYETLAKQLYKIVMNEYNNRDEWDKRSLSMMLDEHLKEFNKKAQKLIEDEIYSNLNKDYFPTGEVPLVADSVLLSSMLYSNAKGVNKKVAAILNESFKAKRTIKDTAMRIYDGYNSNVDNLDVKKGLPKYLLEDRDAMRQIDKLTNKRLKETYKKVYEKLQSLDSKALDKAMWVALQEKSRYYANRIAQTEGARSRNLSRAVEYMEDDEVEYVQFKMSSAHKIVDICNYYASLDVGYGVGIVKKESMRVLPLHPHCHCRYIGYYKKIQKTNIKNPQKNTMDKFSKFEQKSIVGSRDKLREFQQGAEIEGLFNRVRPKYPITKYSDVLGYNGGMRNINELTNKEKNALKIWSEKKKNSQNIRKVIYKNFKNLTSNEIYFEKEAKIINEMFIKYDSLFSKTKPIYRGKVFYLRKPSEKEAFNKFVSNAYNAMKQDSVFVPDSVFRSATSELTEALKFAEISNKVKKSVIVTYKKRISNELDISSFSAYSSEREILINGNLRYKVVNFVTDEEKNIFIELEEIL